MISAGTLFSGIGAPECAAPYIDWRWAAEIDPFAAAVHAARFPHIPNLGNVLEIDWHAVEPVDLVVGGPPCQDYSVAGQRASLSGARGDLTLQYARILDAIDPAWSVTENVPGWLSTPDNAFGAFLGILAGADAALVPGRGQRWTDAGVVAGPRRTAAWRILDAQYFGVPQRRRRVFVVACRGAGNFACAEALFPLRESVRRDTAPGKEARQAVAGSLGSSSPRSGKRLGRREAAANHLIADSLRADGFNGSEDGTGRVTPLVPVAFDWQQGGAKSNSLRTWESAGTLEANRTQAVMTLAIRGRGDSHDLEYRDDGIANAVLQPGGGRGGIGVGAIAFAQNQQGAIREMPYSGRVKAEYGMNETSYVREAMSVRRLTPAECARLQGFPDDWCAIEYRGKPAADGPMYRAYGNSMAVPVIGWVLARVQQIATSSLEEAA